MQVSVETTGALERRMEVQVPAERVEQAIEQRLLSMSRTVRLKGFRPGKVPVKVVRQQFGMQVRQEVLGDVMQSSFAEAVAEQKLQPVDRPRIEPISLEQGQDLKYRATFEVFPQIELKGLDTIEIKRPVASVTTADVDYMIEHLRGQRATYVATDREARDTDRVTVDFNGTLNGEPFEGGKGENVPIILGAGRMLPEFEAGLQGVKAGDSKTIEVSFPENYAAKHLAGQKVQFEVQVKSVEERQLPELDDEFCRAYGVESGGIDQLRREVEENMARELEEAIRMRIKAQVLDKLLETNPIELPKALVEQQVTELQLDAGRRMGAREVSQLPPRENFVEAAKRRVALGLLMNEVIKQGKIEVDRARVQRKLEELAQQFPNPEQALKVYREDRQMQRQIENLVLEDQAIDWLLERARMTDEPATFRELMNFGA
jgi:trigger factor